ncbi:LiaF transmembrane domain-containing protein [Anaerocolumna sp. MB42-C2]|uniref:LiaF transmembrane domain-containing protein n=1 Tax=Anaerocolumna sp. MB42-C2 TaxID=3070997 RepID=UPI0027E0BD4F|nr:hypothetical protein [Anaerocolumna sp. MB42-C2]WMJ87815.1 hypothetical protein RBU59_27930 [Anaerocolumna sp. MB42-C2]
MKMHRVGTFTLGSGLILFGVLFIIRVFTGIITYQMVFKLWPLLLIILGSEILAGHYKEKEAGILYDRAAIFLIILLTFFSMGMACMQYIFENGGYISF